MLRCFARLVPPPESNSFKLHKNDVCYELKRPRV